MPRVPCSVVPATTSPVVLSPITRSASGSGGVRVRSPSHPRIPSPVTLGSPRGSAELEGIASGNSGVDWPAMCKSSVDPLASLMGTLDRSSGPTCEVPVSLLRAILEKFKSGEEERQKLATTVEQLGKRTEQLNTATLHALDADRRELMNERERLKAERLSALEATKMLEEARQSASQTCAVLKRERLEAERVAQSHRAFAAQSPGAWTPNPLSAQLTCRMVQRSMSEGAFNCREEFGHEASDDVSEGGIEHWTVNVPVEAEVWKTPVEDDPPFSQYSAPTSAGPTPSSSRRVQEAIVPKLALPPTRLAVDDKETMVPKLAIPQTRLAVDDKVIARFDEQSAKQCRTRSPMRNPSPGTRRTIPLMKASPSMNPRDSTKKILRAPGRQSARSSERQSVRP